jgi:hypothetical protein
MRRTFILLALCSSSACTSVEALRPDMHARPVPSRLDEIAYINGLRRAYDKQSGSTSNCYKGEKLKEFRPKFVQGYREVDRDAERLDTDLCLRFTPSELPAVKPEGATKPVSSQAPAIQDYLDNGFGLADLYCSRFMQIAAETRQSRKIQRNTASAVDVLVGIVLTQVAAGAEAIAIANGAFGAIQSTYQNIDDAFVIAPEKESLIRLVQNAQDAFRGQARQKPPRSFAEGRSFVERYASMCTYDGMRALVTGSVQLASQSLANEKKKTETEDTAKTTTTKIITATNNGKAVETTTTVTSEPKADTPAIDLLASPPG